MRKLPVIICLLFTACANPYAQYYRDGLAGKTVSQLSHLEPTTAEPKIFVTEDMDRDAKNLYEDGYAMIGESSFNAAPVNNDMALAQAKAVGAAIVLVITKHTETVSGSLPVQMPNTSHSTTNFNGSAFPGPSFWGTATTTTTGTTTTYIPYTVRRYDHWATFWVKNKPRIFGVNVVDLPVSEKQRLERNKGVIVTAVVKGSPAFEAGVLEGDVLLKINDEEFTDYRSLSDIGMKYAGQKVVLTIMRKAQERQIPVTLGPRP